MRLLRRITLAMSVGHHSPANTAVSLELRRFGTWGRSVSNLRQQNCRSAYAGCSSYEFGDDSKTLEERQSAAMIETWRQFGTAPSKGQIIVSISSIQS
jgi:hypothetical protein